MLSAFWEPVRREAGNRNIHNINLKSTPAFHTKPSLLTDVCRLDPCGFLIPEKPPPTFNWNAVAGLSPGSVERQKIWLSHYYSLLIWLPYYSLLVETVHQFLCGNPSFALISRIPFITNSRLAGLGVRGFWTVHKVSSQLFPISNWSSVCWILLTSLVTTLS